MDNAQVNYWLVDTHVIEQRTITSSMYLQQAKDFVSEKILGQKPRNPFVISYPHAGEKHIIVHPSPQGQPVGGGMANAVWLAFCSGTYLQQAEALGASMNTSRIDEAILAVANSHWQKVAMIIAKVSKAVGVDVTDDEGYEVIGSRIQVLVQRGQLESQGDLSRPRYSEVRLPYCNASHSIS